MYLLASTFSSALNCTREIHRSCGSGSASHGSCCSKVEQPAVRVLKADDADVTSGIKTHCTLGRKCFTEKADQSPGNTE